MKILSAVLVRCECSKRCCHVHILLISFSSLRAGLQAIGSLHEDVILVLPLCICTYYLPHVWDQYK